jgi:hypothetical protein
MSKIINWVEYFTRDELEKKIDEHIYITAEELVLELRQAKLNDNIINTKEVMYV